MMLLHEIDNQFRHGEIPERLETAESDRVASFY